MSKKVLSSTRKGFAIWTGVLLLGLLPNLAGAQKKKIPERSGFLTDYSQLAKDPAEKGSRLIYENPDHGLGDFDALYLEEVVFYLYPQEETKEVDPERAAKIAELTLRFDNLIREELTKQGANLVDESGPRVLHCRWAITNLGKSKSVMRVVPTGFVLSTAMGVGRGGAALESECTDGGSGEIVRQVIRADRGSRKSGVTTWAGAESAIRKWARVAAQRLAEAKKSAVH